MRWYVRRSNSYVQKNMVKDKHPSSTRHTSTLTSTLATAIKWIAFLVCVCLLVVIYRVDDILIMGVLFVSSMIGGILVGSRVSHHFFLGRVGILRMLRVLLPAVIGIGIINAWTGGVMFALITSFRMVIVMMIAYMISINVSPHTILRDDSYFTMLLVRCRVPIKAVRLIVTIVFRSMPLLVDIMEQLLCAMRLRGYRRGSFKTLKVVFPLLLQTVLKTDYFVDSLLLRGYHQDSET